jgi:hypothetical protein
MRGAVRRHRFLNTRRLRLQRLTNTTALSLEPIRMAGPRRVPAFDSLSGTIDTGLPVSSRPGSLSALMLECR